MKEYPIIIRYYNRQASAWRVWSQHRSRRAAERAFREGVRDMPDVDWWIKIGDTTILDTQRCIGISIDGRGEVAGRITWPEDTWP